MAYQHLNCYIVLKKRATETEEASEESMELDIRTKLSRESKIRKFVINSLKLNEEEVIIFKTFKKR